jgi:predicted AAA+ superfamily ATPase
MPHLRDRYVVELLKKQAKLWPVVGLLGPRQSGKSTIFRDLLKLGTPKSLDQIELKEEARRSPASFLEKLPRPALIDEVQKGPELFDAIKFRVDQNRIPGSFFLTGSSGFSSKIGIRESLTGRIGLTELLPMVLGELHQKPFEFYAQWKTQENRFGIQEIMPALLSGGMPVPAFLRDPDQRDQYWTSWLQAVIYRDLAPFFTRGFDPDFAMKVMLRMAVVMKDGELPTLKHFKEPARKVRSYLEALQEVFLVRKIPCHSMGIGKEVWIFFDSGFAAHLMGTTEGEGVTLSLARHFLWNERAAQFLYRGKRFMREYFKSAQGSPVDIITEDQIPIRIVPSATDITRRMKIEERSVLGAMKRLDVRQGYLLAPVEHGFHPPKKGGVGVLPWGVWS